MAFETISIEIPDRLKTFVEDVESLGRKHYKVTLKSGWCFNEDKVHKTIIECYALYKTFGEITECGCMECILKGAHRNRKIFGKTC